MARHPCRFYRRLKHLRRLLLYSFIVLLVLGVTWRATQPHDESITVIPNKDVFHKYLSSTPITPHTFEEEWKNLENPSLMYDVSIEMMKRVHDLRARCRFEDKDPNPQPHQFFLDIPDLNLRFCKVSKVGSTTWDDYLSQYAPKCRGKDAWSKFCVNEQWALQFPPLIPHEQWKKEGMRPDFNNVDSFNFLMVRHPFERIVSAYRDKFENNKFSSIKYFEELGRETMLKYRVVPDYLSFDDKIRLLEKTKMSILTGKKNPEDLNNPYQNPPWPTFAEFSSSVLLDGIFERHWWPISDLCHPCSINYTAIGHMGTFNRDSAYVIKNLGLSNKGWPQQLSPGPSTETIWKRYFSTLSQDLLNRYAAYYKSDCYLFGFDCDISLMKSSMVGKLPEHSSATLPDSQKSMSGFNHTFFSAKSPYRFIGGNITSHKFTCKPTAVFGIHRHGMRNVGSKPLTINRVQRVLNKIISSNGMKPVLNIDWIHNFTYSVTPNKDLTPEGYIELMGQGERFKAAFPHLLDDPGKVQITASYYNRCVGSAMSFLYGMLKMTYHTTNATAILDGDVLRVVGNLKEICATDEGSLPICIVNSPIISPEPGSKALKMFNLDRDRLVRFYDYCYECERDYNYLQSPRKVIPDRFTKNPNFVKVIREVSKRVGANLDYFDLSILHVLCVFEVSVPRFVPGGKFCSLFRGNDHEYLSYYMDLLLYNSLASPERAKAACVIMQEALSKLRQGQTSFIFTHSQALVPLLEHMKYFNDTLLRWREDIKNRDFYGDVVGFGSAFTLVTMEKCNPGIRGTLVQAFINENPIDIPDCGEPCTLERLEEMFPASQCNYKE